MGTLVLLFIFCVITLGNPGAGLLIYFLHWAYCRIVGKPTMFERIEAAVKRGFHAVVNEDKSNP